ncbi:MULTISPECIES: hypothetical protein [unclassified Pseudomonas]|uniref:hypothetical protein n=1 Tax=unclassified Pseudomonas TaxID=196821 RepID=UPI001474D83A|nr:MULTISPECIES: hypothetical protein [unclassified Pseudomonas]NMY39450.1 hypothetical protein [Pseudomonas sp. WS 5078]NMY62192.1 hypothetical protein [Pseudomonas sp. WS 5354]
MARKDNKQASQPAWAHRVAGRAVNVSVKDPVVRGVIAGNPAGLLERKLLDKGIEVEIPDWGQQPPPNEADKISLRIARVGSSDYVDLKTETYPSPITGFPQIITIPSDFLLDTSNEGPFELWYVHFNYVETETASSRVPIVIDKIPPNFPDVPGKVTFGFGGGPIFDTTLNGLTDIEGTVPSWTGAAEGDQIAFTWLPDKLPEDPENIDPIDVVPGTDGKVKIPVATIKALPDGRYCCGYTLIDKAGNRSLISAYDLIPVALGDLPPSTMVSPTVPEASDGIINRADAYTGVHVEFPRIPNGKETDEIEIVWGSNPVSIRTPVGVNPERFSLPVPIMHMKDEYGVNTGEVDTPVYYTVYRGGVAFESEKQTVVKVDFFKPGPENPDWPDPTNPALLAPKVFGQSGVENVLEANDEDQPIRADITLVAPLADGDTYQVYWNGKAIGIPYIIDTANDTAGDTVPIDLDWDVIKPEGNSAKMPVHYTLSNSAAAHNDDSSVVAHVQIDFLKINLPLAEPQNLIGSTTKRLTCRSLVIEGGEIGFHYLIPPSDYLKSGMTIDVEWKAYTTYGNPVLVPGAGLSETLGPISDVEAANGVMWFVGPYDTKILPTWAGPTDQEGKGEVTYTLSVNGKDETSAASDTGVVLSAGGGTCDLSTVP